MASNSNTLYVTFVEPERNFLKIWGQRNRIGASYIERQLSQFTPELNKMPSINPALIRRGMLCYARYEGNYYRARVISDVENDTISVFFVDFGNRNTLHVSNIRVLEGTEDVLLKMAEQVEEYYLAGVAEPAGSWTKEIIGEITRICYEELPCNEVGQVGNTKFIELLYQNEDFSSLLIKKQFAQRILPNIQAQMVLTCSQQMLGQQGSVQQQQQLLRSLHPKATSRLGQQNLQQAYDPQKMRNSTNYLKPYGAYVGQTNQSVPNTGMGHSYYNPGGSSCVSNNVVEASKGGIDPMLYNQFSNMPPMKDKAGQLLNSYNNVMIEALAQQIKQYIAEENAKSAPEKESIPHNYVSSVLEVGSTHYVFVSCIDDGPWSFSVQLVSAEDELNRLMKEITSTQLVPIKAPILLGQSCIAASAVYGNLCRGVIVSVSHSAVKVYLVDFGDSEDLPVSSIYELPQKFFKIRVLSQKFCLSGLNKVTYSDDIKSYFKETVQNKLLILQVASLEGDNLPSCELYLNDENIKKILNKKIQNSKVRTDDFPLRVGDTERVVVTWIDGLQRFYVQLRSRDGELNALKDELSQTDVNGQSMVFEDLKLGLKCVCKYREDEQWYRVIITSFVSEKLITVLYIDYGNTEIVDISLLRKLDRSKLINRLEPEAIQCSLHGFDSELKNQELKNEFENLALERDLNMTVLSKDKGQYSVKLMINEEDIVPIIMRTHHQRIGKNSQFEHLQLAPSANEKSYEETKPYERTDSVEKNNNRTFYGVNKNRRGEESENWRDDMRKHGDGNKGFKQDKENRLNEWNRQSPNNKFTRNQEFSDRKSDVSDDRSSWGRTSKKGHKQEEGFRDPKKSDNNKRWKIREGKEQSQFGKADKSGKGHDELSINSDFDGSYKQSSNRSNSRTEKNRKSSKSFEETKRSKRPIEKEDLAPPGSRFQERVVILGSTEKAVITYYVNPHEFYVQLLAHEEDFKKMMQDIQVFYSDKYSIKEPLQEGDLVVAQFSYDNILYRGEVVSSTPLVVLYVDYGNQEEVSPLRSWEVTKQFLGLPKQVVRCRLANVEPTGSEWLPLGSGLDKFFESEEYKCTFLGCGNGVYEILLEDLDTGKDVGDHIVSSGFAVPKISKPDIPEVDFTLLPSQVLRLYVSHVETPEKFFVLLNPDSLKKLEEEIRKYKESVKSFSPLEDASLKVGAVCLVTCDESSWSRGNIVSNVGDDVSVCRIDIGDTVNVTKDKIKTLPDHLKLTEPQAVECSLNTSGSVSVEDFKEAVQHKYIPILIVSETDKRLSVILFDQNGSKFDFQSGSSVEQVEPIGELPIVIQRMPVSISSFEAPEEIYIQRATDIDKFKDLSLKLTDFYKDDPEAIKFEGERGALVAAKSADSGTWHRGRVIRAHNDTVDVIYIDSGKRETLRREGVKKLDASFHDLNALSRKMRLNLTYNAEELRGINEKIATLAEMSDLTGYFVRENDDFILELTVNGARVTESLVPRACCSTSSSKFDKIIPVGKPLSNTSIGQWSNVDDGLANSSDGLRVFVIHIESPKKFWVHKESSINELQQLQDRLQKACETLSDIGSAKVGDMVAAWCCDVWYRGIVETVEGNIATVKLIDYGNVIQVDLSRETVKELSPDLVNQSSSAVEFSLKGTWKESATAKFEEMILEYEDPIAAVVLEDTEPPIVDLYIDGLSIYEKLIQENVGAHEELSDSDLSTVYISHFNSPNDFYVQKDSLTEVLERISTRLADVENLENVTSVRESDICVAKYPEDDVWYRAKVLTKRENETKVIFIDFGNVSNVGEVKRLPPELAGIEAISENCGLLYGRKTDEWSEEACARFEEYADGRPLKMKVVVESCHKSIVQLFSGEKNVNEELSSFCREDGRIEVYVSHVNSPTDFYIQHVDDDNFKLITKALERGDECQDLEERRPGVMCLARVDDGRSWYRAKILRNTDPAGCEVILIDCGKTVISNQLKEPMPDIMEVPPRALRCELNLTERNVPESVKEEFISLTASGERVFRAKMVETGDVNVVSLKLEGRILERTLSSEENATQVVDSGQYRPQLLIDNLSTRSLDDETDDDKNSKKNHLLEGLEDDALVGEGSLHNETDEEKQIKIAIGAPDGSPEGFKSDDEKGISEGLATATGNSMANATDNDLMEEFHETVEELSVAATSIGTREQGEEEEEEEERTGDLDKPEPPETTPEEATPTDEDDNYRDTNETVVVGCEPGQQGQQGQELPEESAKSKASI